MNAFLTTQIINRIFNSLNLYIALLGPQGTLLEANQALLDFSATERAQVVGLPYWELPWINHSEELKNRFIFAMEEAFFGQEVRFAATFQRKDGQLHEIDFIIRPILEQDEVKLLLITGYDISDLVKAQEALTARERQLYAFFEYAEDGYFFYPLQGESTLKKGDPLDGLIQTDHMAHQVIAEENKRLKKMLGKNKTAVLEEEIKSLWALSVKKGAAKKNFSLVLQGETKHFRLSLVSIFKDKFFTGHFGILRDITAQVAYEETLSFHANHDALTGAYNRRLFFEDGNRLLEDFKEHTGLFMIDLDHFKRVNDTYGHLAGDEILRETIRRIRHDGACKVYRYGGEEFSILCQDLKGAGLEDFAMTRLRLINQQPYAYQDTLIPVTASIGATYLLPSDKTLDDTIARADEALYESKSNGRNRLTIK